MRAINLRTVTTDWTNLMEQQNRDSEATVILREDAFTHAQLPKARLICLDKFLGEGLEALEVPLVEQPQTLGRGRENSVYLNYKTLSREHARIFPERNDWVIEDLDSSNGVFVNDEKIRRKALTPGDIVKLASLSFRFVYDPVSQPQAGESPADLASAFTTSGADRTMYSGHPGVVGSLAADVDSEPGPAELPEPIAKRSAKQTKVQRTRETPAAAPVESEQKRTLSVLMRVVLPILLFLLTSAGTYLYFNNSRNQQIDTLASRLKGDIHKFVEAHDSDAALNATTDARRVDQDLNGLAADLTKAVGAYPDSVDLRELQARVIFLGAERSLQALARKDGTDLQQATDLVQQTSGRIEAALGKDEFARNRGGLRDLTALADAIVKFKRFSSRYPTPGNDGQDQPGADELRAMQLVKDLLVKKKRENHLALSVSYPFFQRLVAEVEETDVRIYNRWRELQR